jgi:hypothetical protein
VQIKESDEAQDYLERYFTRMDVSVYWGDANEFVRELSERWERHRRSRR